MEVDRSPIARPNAPPYTSHSAASAAKAAPVTTLPSVRRDRGSQSRIDAQYPSTGTATIACQITISFKPDFANSAEPAAKISDAATNDRRADVPSRPPATYML